MTAPRRLLLILALCGLVAMVVLIPAMAGAQNLPLPGQEIEENKPWTFWLSFLTLFGAAGLALLVGFSFMRLQRRFFGKEELPEEKLRRPQVLGAAAPRQMSAAPASAPSAAPAAPATEATAPEKAEEAEPEKPSEPAAEKPAEPAAEEKPSEPESKPKEEPAGPDVEVPAGLDAETFTRVLKEELDKGTAGPVAEGRARAAAVRAARANSGGP